MNTINFNKNNSYVAILAGGVRSSSLSENSPYYPNEFLDILNSGETLLQATLRRFVAFIPIENIFAITAEEYVGIVGQQLSELPKENILGEPESKNTAVCVAYISAKLLEINPETNLIIAPSDHQIGKEDVFLESCITGLQFTQKYNVFVTLGIKPNHPNEGLGYINFGQPIVGDNAVHEVYDFTEKPDREKAEILLAQGDYLWNSGIFIGKATVLMDALSKFQPVMFRLFDKVKRHLNSSNEKAVIKTIYQKCPTISIDYAVMEYVENIFVIPSSFEWDDMGTQISALKNFAKDEVEIH
ncbi:mannose-1-phosphate guanylyltransferase [Echinicola shivajiensis]|uniref:mannose-1-phosphate guanylyltransferase n=1 Tax=Echinicola shivajiensis TaxID=1035916 RepID=UPI001BFC44CB|nr:mannose-1-phosphate guanylyltransferase [Echinicola shivajiensis]